MLVLPYSMAGCVEVVWVPTKEARQLFVDMVAYTAITRMTVYVRWLKFQFSMPSC